MNTATKAFDLAREQYGALGVDVEKALHLAAQTPISMHCWQGDDVLGFEGSQSLTGGIAATGNYPGRARTPEELRMDMEKALSLLPGVHKVNLHANYLDTTEKVDRDALAPRHFASWAQWAREQKLGLDFNTTFFSHPKSTGGTLTHPDKGIRDFWIAHGRAVREIAAYFSRETGKTCIINHWIPDGEKELPVDALGPRLRLKESLDAIFHNAPAYENVKDAVESKLFGIGAEAYTPGSHEFYMGYVLTHPNLLLTIDAGHFHPTESVAVKIPALLCFLPELLLHVSRPVRWDSDHVVLFDEETRQIMREIVRAGALDRVYLATDYFDASINRILAWVAGLRSARKSLLAALLEPLEELRALEQAGDYSARLALSQEILSLPFGAVWEELCRREDKVPGAGYIQEIKAYEKGVLSKR